MPGEWVCHASSEVIPLVGSFLLVASYFRQFHHRDGENDR